MCALTATKLKKKHIHSHSHNTLTQTQVLFGGFYYGLDTEFTGAFSFPQLHTNTHDDNGGGGGSEQDDVVGYGKHGQGLEARHFGFAWTSLFVLTTSENYPGIMYPALVRGSSKVLALAFFVSFIVLVLYLILNVLLAATYSG